LNKPAPKAKLGVTAAEGSESWAKDKLFDGVWNKALLTTELSSTEEPADVFAAR